MTRTRVAFIGCGDIAEFHAPAFRAAGFDIAAVCSRPESTRLRSFGERHSIPLVFNRITDLLDAREEWDALLIAVTEKWLRKSEQGDKWNRCLIEGMIVLSETGARDEQTTPP